MSTNVEFNITAEDLASDVFEEVSRTASECFDNIESGASEMASDVNTSTSTIADNQPVIASSMQNNVSAIGMMATASAGLVMSVYSLESAEVSLDRAHVMVEKDTTAVTLAQQTYNKAVLDYGVNSIQAKDAADKLKDAQDALTVAQERVGVAQNNVNSAIMMSAVMIIPSAMTMFTSLNTLMTAYPGIATAVSGATEVMGTAMDFLAANPIFLVIAGLVALGLGLYEAYEHCAPFREAVNEIGAVLEGAFKTALTAIEKAISDVGSVLRFVWNDVLKPVGEFLKDVLVADFDAVMAPIKLFEDAINAVAKVAKPLTDLIGGLGNALKGLCFAHAAPAAEEFNSQISKSIELSKGLTENLNPLSQGLMSVSGGGSSPGAGNSLVQQQNLIQQELVYETKNLANIMSKLITVSGRSGTLNQTVAQAMARRF
ncbi:MAG TPA: hypothetical protein VK536_05540 [Candidatus Limnocylindrales bacterium]|nr:hypothetical protein [Candidatus Limnocylindrales bacterium]